MRLENDTSPVLVPHKLQTSKVATEYDKRYLIVPIFFQRQIESVLEAHMPNQGFGFFYGCISDNYRILKKIWPLKRSVGWNKAVTTEVIQRAHQIADESQLALLGCFHTGPLVQLLDWQDIKGISDALFSNIRLNMKAGKTHFWSSTLIDSESLNSRTETIIL